MPNRIAQPGVNASISLDLDLIGVLRIWWPVLGGGGYVRALLIPCPRFCNPLTFLWWVIYVVRKIITAIETGPTGSAFPLFLRLMKSSSLLVTT